MSITFYELLPFLQCFNARKKNLLVLCTFNRALPELNHFIRYEAHRIDFLKWTVTGNTLNKMNKQSIALLCRNSKSSEYYTRQKRIYVDKKEPFRRVKDYIPNEVTVTWRHITKEPVEFRHRNQDVRCFSSTSERDRDFMRLSTWKFG